MNGRGLWALIGAAGLAIVLAVWLSASRAPETQVVSPGALAPGLSEALGNIERVRITGAGNTVLATMERQGDGWGVKEKHGYPVDVEKLRQLLTAVASAQRIEAKTALPERYAMLGVESVEAADAHGVQLDIETPNQQFHWVFGNNVVRGQGTYVRQSDEAQSWLIGSNIAVERVPANWLVKSLLDVGANSVEQVLITPEEGPAIDMVRTEDQSESDFVLKNLPRGRTAAEGFQREALAGFLSGLIFEDVFAADERPLPEVHRTARYRLRDGRVLTIRSWKLDQHTLATFDMQLDEEIATAWLSRPVTEATEQGTEDVPTLEGLRQSVDDFQKAHNGWVYQIPAFKAGNLNKPLEEYLAPKG